MLKIEGLNAAYGSIQVLKNISLKVPKGKVVSIIGANGAGKSTLLKSISGLIKINKDKDIAGMPANRIVGLGISQVPEGRQIFAHLSVLDNIHLGAYLYFKRNNRAITALKSKSALIVFTRFSLSLKHVPSRSPGHSPVANSRCWPLPVL